MLCPRCSTELAVEHHAGIEVDHCLTCHGRWLDHKELDALEARHAHHHTDRSGTIQYARRESSLACPLCRQPMVAFNYRGFPIELDTCESEHGFWLDAGEAPSAQAFAMDGDHQRTLDLLEQQIDAAAPTLAVEESWTEFLGEVSEKSTWVTVRSFFRRSKSPG